MVVVVLQGGLGNQLFQYAAAKALAVKRRTEVYIDSRTLELDGNNTKRKYELGAFNIKSRFATLRMIHDIEYPSGIRKWKRKMMPSYKKGIYNEPYYHYDRFFLMASSATIVRGYLQSQRYFGFISDIIRDEFLIVGKLSEKTIALGKHIAHSNSVSIHIRRGDYISNKETGKFHGCCSLEYYEKAIHIIASKAHSTEFFIFSDDMEWARQNLKIDFPTTFVDHNGEPQAYEDLYLMSLCKHNIIANSSFSWWGAWLNKNPGKVVVAPARWFNESNADTKDLLPEEWLKV
jgi:hypothetical protein